MENSELLTTELHMDAEHPEVSGGFLYSLVLWETGFVCFSGFASIVYACDAVILIQSPACAMVVLLLYLVSFISRFNRTWRKR